MALVPVRDFRPKAADLDKLTANIRANNGRVRTVSCNTRWSSQGPLTVAGARSLGVHGACMQVSFYIKRWCNASATTVVGSGFDDNQFNANNFQYVRSVVLMHGLQAQGLNQENVRPPGLVRFV